VIVVDTNVLVYLLVLGEHTEQAERVFLRDPMWAAPPTLALQISECTRRLYAAAVTLT
jgi:predicted nucleic acid-binding protein